MAMTERKYEAETSKRAVSFTRAPNGNFTMYRGAYVMGAVYLKTGMATDDLNGWYAYEFKHGRQSRQRVPSATPMLAAEKQWGAKARDQIAALAGETY